MKICIVSQTYAPQDEGGAEISSRHAAHNLALRGHDVVVLSLGQKGNHQAEVGECKIDAPYRLHRVEFRNFYLPGAKKPDVSNLKKALWHVKSAWGAVRKKDLESFFIDEGFDLIYAQNSSRMQSALYRVAAQLNIPVCQHLRDYALLCPRTSMHYNGLNPNVPPLLSRVLTWRARSASRNVTTVIAVSNFVRQRFLDNGLFRDANFHVLHNTNTSAANFDANLRAARPTPEQGFTFGYLGALSREKGVEIMLDAFSALPLEYPARLIIAGRGNEDYVRSLKEKVSHLPKGRIEWLGHVTPEKIFSRSEVIILPSIWHEPQSRVLIESAIYSVPVFAARTGGSTEVIENYKTGTCYDAQDVKALSALMQNAACMDAKSWRAQFKEFFPGLSEFKGTAEETNFYDRLELILSDTVRVRTH